MNNFPFQLLSNFWGSLHKGGIPPSAPFGPGPFREKGLAPPAQGRFREGKENSPLIPSSKYVPPAHFLNAAGAVPRGELKKDLPLYIKGQILFVCMDYTGDAPSWPKVSMALASSARFSSMASLSSISFTFIRRMVDARSFSSSFMEIYLMASSI